MSERLYIPTAYVDEICPPGRPSPDAWIGAPAGDVWRLVPCEEGDEPTMLRLGEIVEFAWVEELGSIEVDLHADGTHTTHGAVPADATHFWLKFEPETLASSMDELMRFWRENDVGGVADERIDVRMARWAASDEPYRFEVREGRPKFVLVGDVA